MDEIPLRDAPVPTVGELFQSLDMHAVLETVMVIADIPEDEEEEFDRYYAGHRTAYEEILTLKPKPLMVDTGSPLICAITTCEHHHVHICGMNATGERFALELMEWECWLNFPIKVSDGLKHLTPEEILANILYEMTYVAYSNAEVTNVREGLLDTVQEFKKEMGIEEVKPTLH